MLLSCEWYLGLWGDFVESGARAVGEKGNVVMVLDAHRNWDYNTIAAYCGVSASYVRTIAQKTGLTRSLGKRGSPSGQPRKAYVKAPAARQLITPWQRDEFGNLSRENRGV